MKVRVTSILFVIAVLLLPLISLGQQPATTGPGDRKAIDWFHFEADYHSNTLLFKLLRFNAPFPGYYEETSLQTNGDAFSARIVPNWAVQGSVGAKLDDALVARVRQMLTELRVLYTPTAVEPLPGQMHSVFVFYDGHDFLRLNYNGPHPAQIDAILAILHKEFTAVTKARLDEIAAHQKSMRETYGDWQNRPGITLNAGSLMHGCKGNEALVVMTVGQRKSVATSSLVTTSLYHVLVFYPATAVTGSGSGGRWGDDPVQSYVLTWTLPNANRSSLENTSQRKFEILHNAIDATVTIAGKKYPLSGGNMFVVRIGADWVPTVTQLDEVFEEQSTAQSTLDRFKAILKNDASVQKLELY